MKFIKNIIVNLRFKKIIVIMLSGLVAPLLISITYYFIQEKLDGRVDVERMYYAEKIMNNGKNEESIKILDELRFKSSLNNENAVRVRIDIACALYQLSKEINEEDNLKSALFNYNDALSILNIRNGIQHAHILSNRSAIYLRLSSIRANNKLVELAAADLVMAKRIFKENKMAEAYFAANANLSSAYATAYSITGERSYADSSISILFDALQDTLLMNNNEVYSSIMNNIGSIYNSVSVIERSLVHKVQGKAAFKNALSSLKITSDPMKYSEVLNNYAVAIAGSSIEIQDIRYAIELCENAIQLNSEIENKHPFAKSNQLLGYFYAKLATATDSISLVHKSIKASNAALQVFSITEYPLEYATTYKNLGYSYQYIGFKQNTIEYIDSAVIAYSKALKVFSEIDPVNKNIVESNLKFIKLKQEKILPNHRLTDSAVVS